MEKYMTFMVWRKLAFIEGVQFISSIVESLPEYFSWKLSWKFTSRQIYLSLEKFNKVNRTVEHDRAYQYEYMDSFW